MNLPLHPKRDPTTSRLSVGTSALPDTGAQAVISEMGLVHNLGLARRDLIQVSLELQAANQTSIKIIGGMIINIMRVSSRGEPISTKQLCYVCGYQL